MKHKYKYYRGKVYKQSVLIATTWSDVKDSFSRQVLGEDLRLVEGQQNRMQRGANVWNLPVAYDKLGVRYRRWRQAVESGKERIPFTRDQ